MTIMPEVSEAPAVELVLSPADSDNTEKSSDAVAELRREAAKYRHRMREAEKRAAELDEQRSAVERSTSEKIADLEARLARAEADSLRGRIAAAYGIAPEDADLLLTATDEKALTAQAERLAATAKARPASPLEGTNKGPGGGGGNPLREVARAIHNIE